MIGLPDATQRALNKTRTDILPSESDNQEFAIPNLSGDLSRARVLLTPTEDTHVVNKAYADSIAAAGIPGLTASAAELNILDGATLDTTELNYVDGVTSAIQTQLNNKAASSHTHTKADLTDIADFLLESEVDADIKTLTLPASTTISTFGASLVDDAAASNARTTLGLGDFAVLDTTSDHSSADTTYVPLVLYNTDATPPAANTVPIGTIYIQYTP